MSFTNIVDNIFGNPQTKNNSLNQGANFNGMQKKIINGVLPDLPLISQTTMPGLGSVVESLENMKKSSPLTTESSLQKLDETGFAKIKKLETEFAKKLTEYSTAYKENSKYMLSTCNTKDLAKIKWCKDAGPWEGDFGCCVMQNKQPCPTGRALYNDFWSPVNLDGYPKCKGGTIGSLDNTTFGASDKLAILNDQLMNLSKQMWEATQKIHSSDIKLQQELDNHRQQLGKKTSMLQTHQTSYNKLYDSQNTLAGQVIDNKRQTNSMYMHYLVWFVAATTIGAIAMKQALK